MVTAATTTAGADATGADLAIVLHEVGPPRRLRLAHHLQLPVCHVQPCLGALAVHLRRTPRARSHTSCVAQGPIEMPLLLRGAGRRCQYRSRRRGGSRPTSRRCELVGVVVECINLKAQGIGPRQYEDTELASAPDNKNKCEHTQRCTV